MRIASFIDHTILKQTTTRAEAFRIAEEGLLHGFAAICIPPYYVSDCRARLGVSQVKLATVVGFPFGYHSIETKVEETRKAIKDGADEIDLVMNIAGLKNNDLEHLKKEVNAILTVVRKTGKLIKVIIESGILSDNEIIQCCKLYSEVHVDFVKTSTGFAEKSASVAAVQLLRMHLPSSIKIKASGGIRDLAFARQLIIAGANRLGCSASVAIVKEEEIELSGS